MIGVSDNGGRVYFAANGQLAPGAADPGLNLYVRDGATTTFITALDPGFGDTLNWALDSQKTGRVNPSGSALLFSSRAPQLGYDNARFMRVLRLRPRERLLRVHLLPPERRACDRGRGHPVAARQ